MRKANALLVITLGILFSLLITQNVSAGTWTYQETADAISDTGCWSNWYLANQTYDTDWNTYGKSNVSCSSYVYFNYTFPGGMTKSSYWQIKDQSATKNLSFSDGCWQQAINTGILELKASSSNVGAVHTTIWDCKNTSGLWMGESLAPFSLRWIIGTGTSQLYEEGMFWNDGLNYLSEIYTDQVLEYTNQVFNITLFNASTTGIIPKFIYDGTTYTTGIYTYTSGTNITFSKTITIPSVTATLNQTNTFYWNFNYTDFGTMKTENSTINNQTVYRIVILKNDSYGSISTINFTCYDEMDNTQINCTINPSFKLWPKSNYGSSSYRTIYGSKTTNGTMTTYYKYPDIEDFTTDLSLTASSSGYVSKIYGFNNQDLTNISVNEDLYLLSTADGIYVTFQVQGPTKVGIGGVYVVAQKNVQGNLTIINSGYTDDVGSITFFLNPIYSHTMTFSKSGYDTVIFSVTPTQSLYTVSMGGGTQDINQTSPMQGITYNILPSLAQTLQNDTTYSFSLELNSTDQSLANYGFILIDQNGNVLGTAQDTSTDGGTVTYSQNNGNLTTIFMNYYWTINTTTINQTVQWDVYYYYAGQFSLVHFFTDLRNFSHQGFNDFTRALIAFGLIFLVAGLASYYGGLTSPIGICLIIGVMTWMMDYVGLLPVIGPPQNHVMPIVISFFLIGYILMELRR
jgi:hypothetical protein